MYKSMSSYKVNPAIYFDCEERIYGMNQKEFGIVKNSKAKEKMNEFSELLLNSVGKSYQTEIPTEEELLEFEGFM